MVSCTNPVVDDEGNLWCGSLKMPVDDPRTNDLINELYDSRKISLDDFTKYWKTSLKKAATNI